MGILLLGLLVSSLIYIYLSDAIKDSDGGGSGYIYNIRQIGLAMMQYSMAHQNKYPSGDSSTEVFQKLMDEGYLDPDHVDDILYIHDMPGKVPYPGSGPLKPENVCYDVATPVTDRSHDGLPLVISTGWNLTFEEGAIPAEYDQKLTGALSTSRWSHAPAMIIYRKGGSARLLYPERIQEGELIPIGFRQDKTAYRQLRP